MPADTPSSEPGPGGATQATSRRARRAAERAAQLEAELAAEQDVVTTGQMPLGEAELPARPAEQVEPRELLTEPAPTSRVGRNLPVAIAVGLGLGAVLLASLFFRKEVFVGLAVLACIGGLWELDRSLRTRDIRAAVGVGTEGGPAAKSVDNALYELGDAGRVARVAHGTWALASTLDEDQEDDE